MADCSPVGRRFAPRMLLLKLSCSVKLVRHLWKMSENFDIYSKIFFRDVENFVRHLCVLVLRHQMRVSNYFVNSFYSERTQLGIARADSLAKRQGRWYFFIPKCSTNDVDKPVSAVVRAPISRSPSTVSAAQFGKVVHGTPQCGLGNPVLGLLLLSDQRLGFQRITVQQIQVCRDA